MFEALEVTEAVLTECPEAKRSLLIRQQFDPACLP